MFHIKGNGNGCPLCSIGSCEREKFGLATKSIGRFFFDFLKNIACSWVYILGDVVLTKLTAVSCWFVLLEKMEKKLRFVCDNLLSKLEAIERI